MRVYRGTGLQLAISGDSNKEGTPSNLGPDILSKESILLLLLPDPRESLCNKMFTKSWLKKEAKQTQGLLANKF